MTEEGRWNEQGNVLQSEIQSCFTPEGIMCRLFIILSKPFGIQCALSLLSDDSYSTFYSMGDYPVAKYLQEPLYFEVELMRSTNPEVSLELENCWATVDADRTSQPRWNLIING